jgi:hypothetical protein
MHSSRSPQQCVHDVLEVAEIDFRHHKVFGCCNLIS